MSTLRGFKILFKIHIFFSKARFDENAGRNSGRPLRCGDCLVCTLARGPSADTQASSSIALPPCAVGTLVRVSALEVQVPDHDLGVASGQPELDLLQRSSRPCPAVRILLTSHDRGWSVGSRRYLLCHLATRTPTGRIAHPEGLVAGGVGTTGSVEPVDST